MKRGFIIFLIVSALACNNSKKASPNSEASNPIINGAANATDSIATGKELIAGNDCSGCHNPNSKLTGPPFTDIAKKYPNSTGVAENLARSIVSGSKGIWGNVHEMPPHTNVRFPDAVKMAEYILSLKDQMHSDSLNKVN